MSVYVCPHCGRVLTRDGPIWVIWCGICWRDVRPVPQTQDDDSEDQTQMNKEANKHDGM